MSIKPVSDHRLVCDDNNSPKCYGAQIIPESTLEEARAEGERQGWNFDDSWWRDSCPECWPATKARRDGAVSNIAVCQGIAPQEAPPWPGDRVLKAWG